MAADDGAVASGHGTSEKIGFVSQIKESVARRLLLQPHANPTTRIAIENDNPGLFEG